MALSLITPDSLNLAQDYAGMGFGGTGSANQLDDYEEGTFTPVYNSGITSPVYADQRGSYIKIGDFCHFQIAIRLTSGTGNATQLAIAGFPFTSAATSAAYGGAFINYQNGWRSDNNVQFHFQASGTQIACHNWAGGAFGGDGISTITAILNITGSYRTA